MRIKFNWGTGIFIAIVLMISWIGFLVSKSLGYKINIDSDDYYERGLDHTAQMERIKRSLPYKEEFTLDQYPEYLEIHYPSVFADKPLTGELWFYRPSDFELDLKIEASNLDNNTQKINKQHLKKGIYHLRATLNTGEKSYFFEREIRIK